MSDELLSEVLNVDDKVRYSDMFLRRIQNAKGASEKRGMIVAVPQRRGSSVTVKWSDGSHSTCLVDNLHKIPEPKPEPKMKTKNENTQGDTTMNVAQLDTRAVILRLHEGSYVPADEASRTCLVAHGLPEIIESHAVAETNVSAGSHGITLVVEAPRAEVFAQAWDFATELAFELKEDVSLYDRVQWLAANGPDADAAFRVVGAGLSEKFVETFRRGLSKIGMSLTEDASGLSVHFQENICDRSVNPGPSIRTRAFVSADLFETITGIEVEHVIECRVEATATGNVFAATHLLGHSVVIPLTIAEADLLVLASSDKLVESSILSSLHDDTEMQPVAVFGEGALNESKFDVLCYESPKTIKGEKKGFATGILYLAPATASGVNVCPMASGLIAREYGKRLDNGATIDQLLDAAEKDLQTATGSKKKGEVEEIAKILRRAKEKDASRDTTRTWLNTIGCVGACLGIRSGKGVLTKVQASREAKTKKIMDPVTRPELLNNIVKDIDRLVKFSDRKGMTPTVRLNGTSDLEWANPKFHVKDTDGKMKSIFEIFPHIAFYDYTKDPKRMKAHLAGELPKNYYLTFSYSGYNWEQCEEFLKQGGTVAMAFRITKNEPKPKSVNGFKVIDGDETDLRGLDGKGVIVGLSAKGQTGKYVTSFIVSPIGTKFDIKWPKGSKYTKMSEEEKVDVEDQAEERYFNKTEQLGARQKFRELVANKVIESKSYWKKHVVPAAKRLTDDMKSGAYGDLKAYYPDFFPVAAAAFDHFIKEVPEDLAKQFEGKVWNPDDKEYFTGRIVAVFKKAHKESIKNEASGEDDAAAERQRRHEEGGKYMRTRATSKVDDIEDALQGAGAFISGIDGRRTDQRSYMTIVDPKPFMKIFDDLKGKYTPEEWRQACGYWLTEGHSGYALRAAAILIADAMKFDYEALKKGDGAKNESIAEDNEPKKSVASESHAGSIVVEALSSHPDFNRLPLFDQIAVQISSYAANMSWRPLGIKAKDIDFAFMFGLRPDNAVQVRDAVSKALEGVDANQGKFLETDKLYEKIMQILLAPSSGAGQYQPNGTVQVEGPLTTERTIKTYHGEKVAQIGEYVVTGIGGNQWPITAEELSSRYTKTSDGTISESASYDIDLQESGDSSIKQESGTTKEMLGNIGLPSNMHHSVAYEKAKNMLDIHREPTGWKHIDFVDRHVVCLIHPNEDLVVKFSGKDLRSGTEWMMVQMKAQGYAIDHPVKKTSKPSEPGEIITKKIYGDEEKSKKTN